MVKLGGSLITVKDEPYTINMEALEKAVGELAGFHRSGGRLTIVHGGGSFGHAAARMAMERRGGKLLALDAPEIQEAMLKLGIMVVATLRSHGVPATMHPPHTMCLELPCRMEPMVRDLSQGLVPVTYGDALPIRGETIIVSGDDLAAWLAVEVGADCLVYVTRVPGVLGPNGEVLQVVEGLGKPVGGGEGLDVTGGMRRKLEAALRASAGVATVRIVGLEGLGPALRGMPVGTLVRRPARRPS
ncbi:MAG: hypothetical protein F7C08_03220 [Desulfurococcales archaeon]|nr:hypothetical protein [Desulfurococcales archaeon]MCE4605523.1 hypothetical protein [Desulfurococcales archaeon]